MTQSPSSSFPFEVQPTGWTHYRRRRELRGREGPTSSSALSLITTTNSDGDPVKSILTPGTPFGRASLEGPEREALSLMHSGIYPNGGKSSPRESEDKTSPISPRSNSRPQGHRPLLHRRSKADPEEDFNFPRIRRSKKSRSYKGTRLSQRSRESPHASPLSGNPEGIS